MGAGLEIASAVMDYSAKNKAFKANQQSALEDYTTVVKDTGAQRVQIGQSAAESVLETALAEARGRAEASLAGASSGLSGSTVRSMIQEQGAAGGRATTIIRANRDNAIEQTDRDLSGARVKTNRQIRSVAKGNPLNLALQIGTSAAKLFAPVP